MGTCSCKCLPELDTYNVSLLMAKDEEKYYKGIFGVNPTCAHTEISYRAIPQ